MLSEDQIKELKPGDVLYRGFTDVTRARKATIKETTIKSIGTQPVIIAKSDGEEQEFECHNVFFATFCLTRLEALRDIEEECKTEIEWLEKKISLEKGKTEIIRKQIREDERLES